MVFDFSCDNKLLFTTLILVVVFKPIHAQVANGTGSSISEFTFENIVTLTAGIAAAIGLPISLLSIYFGRRKQRMESLIEFFKILNNDDHREARRKIYHTFKEYSQGNGEAFQDENIKKNIAMVRADMDQIGLLYHHNLIPRKIFLEAYWNTVLLCWVVLRENILEQRIQRGYPTYMKYFEELREKCDSYRKKHHPGAKIQII